MSCVGQLLSTLVLAASGVVEADVVIQHVEIHDGSGAAVVKGDIAIQGERIVAVGEFPVAGEPRIASRVESRESRVESPE